MNVNNVWLTTVAKILNNGITSSPRGMEIKELIANQTCIEMKYPILSVIDRKLGYRFLFREAWWIINGRNTVYDIKNFSKAISGFSNDGHYFDGAYGPRIVDQLRYVVDCLEKDRDTRQAVIEIWRPNPRDSKDIPCTINVQWIIRDNTIHCIDTMRSSDIWLGWPYDVFNFTMLTGYIMLLLRDRGVDGLKLGNLYLNAGSQHVYESNYENTNKVIYGDREFFSYSEFNPYKFESPEAFLSRLEELSHHVHPELEL